MNIQLTEQERIRVLNGEDVYTIMQKILLREDKIDREKEHFWIVGLDADCRILFIELVALGGVTSVSVKPMETFRVAVLKNAVSAILVHNHICRTVTPSEADKDLTDHLIQVGRILNIPVLDHLIINITRYFSFEIEGLMDELRKSLKWVPPYEIELRIRNEELRIREEAVRLAKAEGERKGKDEGRKEGRIEVARALLGKGMGISGVVKVSGLSEGEIRGLVGR